MNGDGGYGSGALLGGSNSVVGLCVKECVKVCVDGA